MIRDRIYEVIQETAPEFASANVDAVVSAPKEKK
jgi:hypothetical protein